MIGLGVALVLIGIVALLLGVFIHAAHILLWIGIVVAIVGAVLFLVHRMNGRRTPV